MTKSIFPAEHNQDQSFHEEDDKVPAEVSGVSREIISTLPKANGWRVFDHLCYYQGFWCCPSFLEGTIIAQEHFKAQPSDIVLCSAQKTGTTWLKALAFAIVTRTCFSFSTTLLLSKVPHECVPFLETNPVRSQMKHYPCPSLFHTHIPYTSLPKSIMASKCKIVYVCREPKDVFVSLWHYSCERRQKHKEPLSLEDAFELFCKGINNYGPYWDHVLGYWKASLELPGRIMIIRYEEILRDTAIYVKRLAEFMRCPFSQEEETEGVVEKIVNFCSFENLSKLEVNKEGKHFVKALGTIENKFFFRKGIMGDWKNHLSAEMAGQLEDITEQKLKGSGFKFDDS